MNVTILQDGPGGSIIFREADHEVRFSWEFAMPPAVALIFGPTAQQWSHLAGWAAGRQAEIFATVASEVIRQKAPGCGSSADLETGIMEILRQP